jgi:hypothetical protein
MTIGIVSIQALWRGYLYKKALPLALSQDRHRKIKELSTKLLDIALEKIKERNLECIISEPIKRELSWEGRCIHELDISILSNGTKIACQNLDYTANDWVSLGLSTEYAHYNQKLQQLLYAITIPYCIKNGFKSINQDPVTGASQHMAQKFGFKLGNINSERPLAIDDLWEQYCELYEDGDGKEIKSIFGEYKNLSDEISCDMDNELIVYTANEVINSSPQSEKIIKWINNNKNKVVPNLDIAELFIKDVDNNYTSNILFTLKKLIEVITRY